MNEKQAAIEALVALMRAQLQEIAADAAARGVPLEPIRWAPRAVSRVCGPPGVSVDAAAQANRQ